VEAAELEVELFGRRAGILRRNRDGDLSFGYDAAWVGAGLPPISRSLPVRAEPHGERLTRAFFGNLLPEGGVRDILADRLQVSPEDEFGLLAKIGRDCAGAITIADPLSDDAERAPRVEWLDEDELEQAIADLPRDPLRVAPDEDIRISLAGAQDKLAVVVDGERFGLPVGGRPSTHILKAALKQFEATPSNEAFCLALAGELGLEAPAAAVRVFGPHEVLLIERYDRSRHDGRVEREHQEDFCQALGLPARAKYEDQGGPGIVDSIELLRDAADDPAREILRFLDAIFFNLLIANHDAHGKNFSLLYSRSEPHTRLAPLYDLLSTGIYGIGKSLPMRIGHERKPERVGATALRQLGEAASLGQAQLRDRARDMAARAPNVAAELAADTGKRQLNASIAERIAKVVNQRAVDLHRHLGAA
jgi:serine/threonine-protein kinase HipA